jgi:hypothetical protein
MAVMLAQWLPPEIVLGEINDALQNDPYAADLLVDRDIMIAKMREQKNQ